MRSIFITGTDTNVGKTCISAAIVFSLKKLGYNVGIMKPFATGIEHKNKYKSGDVEILSNAAKINDPEDLINPYFFPKIPSPIVAAEKNGMKIDIQTILNNFKKLTELHEIVIVEGIGGVMTPIMKNYFVVNLIKDLGLETIIVTSNKIGTINNTIMTVKMCNENHIKILGLIINCTDFKGYEIKELKHSLNTLLEIPILAVLPPIQKIPFFSRNGFFSKLPIFRSYPFLQNFNVEKFSQILQEKMSIKSMIE